MHKSCIIIFEQIVHSDYVHSKLINFTELTYNINYTKNSCGINVAA